MKKFTSFIIFIITVIIVALIGLFIHHKFTSRKHVPQPPPTVTVTTLASRTYQTKIHIVGTLIAVNGITLKTAIAGQITKLDFESNQEVKKGQLLLEVDPAELQAQLASDEAQLEKDKLTLDRNKKLVARQVITEEAFDESEASYKQSVAAVAAVQAQLRNAIITAPFAGKIGIRDVQLGDYLSTGDTITTITRLDPLWADFNVPTKYLNSVKIGQIVHINNEAFPDDTFTGKVT
ncbi:MAG: efflux RND transporter periplasmic adaptor subunit, partial [Pseudomonadota bacterium]